MEQSARREEKGARDTERALSRLTYYAPAVREESMKEILDQMEEHIAAIRNLQRNFYFHSKKLEKVMKSLSTQHLENKGGDSPEVQESNENS
jgi:hypothetical protein